MKINKINNGINFYGINSKILCRPENINKKSVNLVISEQNNKKYSGLFEIYKKLEAKYSTPEYRENLKKQAKFLSVWQKTFSENLYNIPDKPFTI